MYRIQYTVYIKGVKDTIYTVYIKGVKDTIYSLYTGYTGYYLCRVYKHGDSGLTHN